LNSILSDVPKRPVQRFENDDERTHGRSPV
jgi:hypothetical protein